ncbi:ISH9-type transposase [Natrialba taiwanensis DSM 12281]|uniref:ISH9-type transposase n=1 Tax=Natrialba taiwanensis DSM 12281 TaxID=1230458 RepID=M0A5R3_9EURY|nr:ISH9-type transposase [Natrialba taiwanensis DSM 12281]
MIQWPVLAVPRAVRAQTWYREFREIALMCVVYNIKRAIKQ